MTPLPRRRLRRPDVAATFGAAARGIRPNPRRSVRAWADAERVVSAESGSPWPGRWTTERVPYLAEIMEKLTLSHPARRVTFRKSAQIGGSECGVNFVGQIMSETPAPVLVVLPSTGEAADYNRLKLDPTIRETPALRAKVRDVISRDEKSSTSFFKRFPGGYLQIVSASTPKQLEMRTARVIVFEEISKYPRDVDGRGSPIKLALSRTDMWTGQEKIFDCSTPHVKGQCEVSDNYEAGSRAVYRVPCPDCGHRQELLFANLRYRTDVPAAAVERADYACEACGVLIDEHRKPAMLAAGAWDHERPELADQHPSYRLNALYSPKLRWVEIVRRYLRAKEDPTGGLKPFWQQALGEAWDESFDLPKADILLLRRDTWKRGQIPPGVLFLVGATDVQGDRLVWAVWGFDRHFGQWLIDTGVLPGDPTQPHVWATHDALLLRRWTNAWGREVAPDAWGIDAGYLSSHVYAYARRHAADTDPVVRALDGRPGWKLLPIGTPVTRDVDWRGQKIGAVQLYPVGTWDMKSELAGALRLTEQGPGPEGWPAGALRFNEIADRTIIDELLSERLAVNPRTGAREWVRVAARNEQWDLAVYARAQARHLTAAFTDRHWDNLAAARQGPPDAAQPDLAALWAPDLKGRAEAAVPAAVPPAAPAQRGRSVVGTGRRLN